MVERIEYRVSWTMWPPGESVERVTERITTDLEGAQDQMTGLRSMEAPHELRPCGEHVWESKLEQRRVVVGPSWEPVDG